MAATVAAVPSCGEGGEGGDGGVCVQGRAASVAAGVGAEPQSECGMGAEVRGGECGGRGSAGSRRVRGGKRGGRRGAAR
jgi:hypothetical protein